MKPHSLLVSTVVLALPVVFAYSAVAQSAPEKSASDLDEVVVTGRFIATGAASATKLNVSTLDTPFSVSAYTQDFMSAIDTIQVADLYRYMTGLQKAGATGTDMTLRGFATSDFDRNAIMTDGLPGLAVRFGSPPTVGTDHIELVKGAASLLYGMVQPGGFVNIITKKPQFKESTEIAVRGIEGASSADPRVEGGDISIDSTGPLDEAHTLAYRFIAQKSSDNRFRDFSYERGDYLAPSVTWLIGDDTIATAALEYRSVQSNYANVFLLAPRTAAGSSIGNLAPFTTNYMSPSDYLFENGLVENVTLNHEFSNGIAWTFSFRNVDHHDGAHAFDMIGFDKTDPTFQTIDIRARGQKNHRTYAFGDSNLVMPFDTFGIEHKVIVGVDLGREVDNFGRLQFCKINSPGTPKADPTCNPTSAQYTVNFLHPDFSNIPQLNYWGPGAIGPSTLNDNLVTEISTGAYISDLVTFNEHWKGTLGFRESDERQENYADRYEPQLAGVVQKSRDLLPQVGAIYEPVKDWSLYVSYSTSFTPVPPGTLGLNNNYNFTPTSGEGYEVGTKADLYNGRLSFTVAGFLIDQTNLIEPFSGNDPIACPSGSCSVQVGGARSKGAEFELNARPLPNWTVLLGYAYTDARITSSNAAGPLIGGLLPNSPANAAHLWTRYDWTEGLLRGLGAGLGLSYTGQRVAYTPTAALPASFLLPAYEVVDLGVYYSLENSYSFTFKITNLLDAKFLSSGAVTSGMVNAQPGTPRTAMATLGYRF